MVISRRNFLRRVGGGAALGAVAASLGGFAHVDGCPLSGSRHPAGPIFLDRNENADGPSERVMGAMRDRLARAHLFPRSDPDALGDQLALLHAVRPDQVVLGCGSSDILRMAAAAFLGPGTSLILSAPSFDAIVQYARGAGADVSAVPLTRQHAHDLESMSHRTNAATRLVYLCNPNNPTGSLTPRGDLIVDVRLLHRSPVGRPAPDRDPHLFKDPWTGGASDRLRDRRPANGAPTPLLSGRGWSERGGGRGRAGRTR
ncbi:MAG: aminotransferase class I/II-fold pyridoxal phosphate-dependent enzyme [Actinobacteria bacterium]|nr:MAG: aminotransferase class I/II-fold pyridoxal phosphate-dependent enzyme [Actinomycetota bacterium]